MSLQYSPKIITDSLVMCLDASQNKSYPTDLPVKNGLLVWLDAADDSTFSYSSGTIVSQWRDKSGNNFHANQSTTSNQPSRSSVMNSRKGVFFNASTRLDYMLISSGISVPTDASIFIIYKPATQVYNYAVLIDNYHGSGNAGFVIQRVNNLSQFYYANGNGSSFVDASASPWTYTDNVIQLLSLNKSGANATPYISGTAQTTRTVYANTAQVTTGLAIGYWGFGGGRFYNGDMCEILIFNRALSSTEMKQVHTYLGQKWGVSNTDRSIIDLSNNNNHGLLGGVAGSQVVADMPLFDVYNKGALKLDGSTDYIAVENATSLNPTTVTVSIWVKRNGYQSQTANYLRRNYNDAYAILSSPTDDSAVRFRIHNGTTYPESPNTTLALNEWTNIVGTYDLTNVKIYKNGVFVGQTAHTSAISYASVNTTLTIGRDDPIAGRYMNANYGSVLIYSRALSAIEISQNYEAQKSKFTNTIIQQGLVLNIDAANPYSYGGAGTTVYDVSNTALSWTTNNTTYNSDPIKYFSYNGSSSWLQSSTSTAYDSQTITMECWFYPTTLTQDGFLFEKGQVNTQYSMFLAFGNTFYFRTIGGTINNQDLTFTTSTYIVANAWNHVVCTYNGSTKIVYVNGIQAASVAASGTLQTGQTNQYIGKYGAAGNNFPFNGRIGESRVYNIALSAAQVLQNYNATKGRFGL
jgi:hypothetical protein